MKKETKLIHSGRNPRKHKGAVNPPISQTSTIIFPTLEDYQDAVKGKQIYDDIGNNREVDIAYGISGTTTTFALQEALIDLEGGDYCWILPSGLAAITTALLSFVEAGDHILLADTVYGPTRRFCNKSLKKLGIEIEYYDPLIGGDIKKLIKKNTRLIFLESPGSLTFEIQDIPAITKVAKSKGILTILDNSWATPLHFKPFEHGVDISIQAITKYINGHADVILGSITATKQHRAKITSCFRNLGTSASPYGCYLALRGLRTLGVRLRQHQESALKIAKWLKKHKKVTRVLYPALPSDPNYKLWKRDFTGANGLLSFVLDKNYKNADIAKFINSLKLFGVGVSWGGFESLALPVDLSETRTATKWKEKNSCIRIHVGLENVDDLIADLEQSLKKLK